MGKQICFFMAPKDEKAFVDMVLQQGDRIAKTRSSQGRLEYFNSWEELSSSDGDYLLVFKESKVQIRASGVIDVMESDVIDVMRCRIDVPERLDYGRLWVEMNYWDEQDEKHTKEKWLEKRFEYYRKWIRKEGRPDADKDFWIFPKAYEMYRQGMMKMMATPKFEVEFPECHCNQDHESDREVEKIAIEAQVSGEKGNAPHPLDEFIKAATEDGYPAQIVIQSICECGNKTFKLEYDQEEGIARRVCSACKKAVFIGDSEENWDGEKLEPYVCSCKGRLFEVGTGFSLREDGDIQWMIVGVRCAKCGEMACPVDWEIDYAPTDHLLKKV